MVTLHTEKDELDPSMGTSVSPIGGERAGRTVELIIGRSEELAKLT